MGDINRLHVYRMWITPDSQVETKFPNWDESWVIPKMGKLSHPGTAVAKCGRCI